MTDHRYIYVMKCMDCGSYRIEGAKHFEPNEYPQLVELYAAKAEKDRRVSHGLCPECAAKRHAELDAMEQQEMVI